MDAAREKGASSLVGPVPFKDVASIDGEDDGQDLVPPHEDDEYTDVISALPSDTYRGVWLRQYQGVWMTQPTVLGVIAVQRRFTPRRGAGDVLLATSPKCGTTWLKALSFAIMARASYPPCGDHPLLRLNPAECVPSMEGLFATGQEAKLEALPSPRLLHTHMHHSLLPPSLAHDPAYKAVYVCREPKDMLVSLWHFIRGVTAAGGGGAYPFSDVLELACAGRSPYGPFWDHFLGYWYASKASPERVLFLRYEEMLADQVGAVRELARFLGVPFTAAEEAAGSPMDIAKLCSIDTLRGLEANKTGKSGQFIKFPNEPFFRKGVAGDWVNQMTPEMARRVDAVVEDKLRGSGLTFAS